jgi:hypothetical protein
MNRSQRRYFDGALGVCVDAAVLWVFDFTFFLCFDTFALAVEVEVAVELD